MSALRFRDEDALRAAILSGLCPAEVHDRPARLARDGAALVLAPAQPLPDDARARLLAAGVEAAPLPDQARAIGSWAEAVSARRVAVDDRPPLVVLVAPGGAGGAGLLDLASELLRLGSERFELCALAGEPAVAGLIRVVDPPTYTLVRAEDGEAGLAAYVPARAGDESVWIERGASHPLAPSLRAPPGRLLFVPAGDRPWWQAPAGGWRPLDDALELAVAATAPVLEPAPLPPRRRVVLRLAPGGRRVPPTLWVARRGGVALVDQLLAHLPDDAVARIRFAVGAGADREPVVLLRARPGRGAPPALSIDVPARAGVGAAAVAIRVDTYAPVAGLNQVLAPPGTSIEPPVGRARLQAVVDADPDQLIWLTPGPDRRFTVERIAERSFAPLTDWADYLVHASAPDLVPWIDAVELELAPFVSSGREWAEPAAPPVAAAPDDQPGSRRRRRARAPEPPAPTRPAPAAPSRAAAPAPLTIAVDEEIARLERSYLDLDAPADDRARLALLAELGGHYAAAGRRRDAGLCLVRVVWEASDGEAASGWLGAEERRAPRGDPLTADQPSVDEVRLIATRAAVAPERLADPHAVQRWLDRHDQVLDARTLWLARLGLAGHAGGDPLALARTRDRLLARLAGGLRVEIELPSFLRFAGRGAAGSAAATELGAALERVLVRATSRRRRRSPVEAPPRLTRAYAELTIAVGFARLGDADRARTLATAAGEALGRHDGDPIHRWLTRAYRARVDQALAGLPAAAPLPAGLLAELHGLERFARYKVDRLREASRILEPHASLDPVAAFARAEPGLDPELAAARALAADGRGPALAAIVAALPTPCGPSELLRLERVVAVLPELPEATALPLLDAARARLADAPVTAALAVQARSLAVAGHFGREDLVGELHDQLAAALAAAPAGTDPGELARALGPSLRALRRVGLRAEAADLLVAAQAALGRGGDLAGLRARLAIAAGQAYLGELDRAEPVFAAARDALAAPTTSPGDRLDLARDLALALAEGPLAGALAGIDGLAAQLAEITDSASTNSHFCLSVLHLTESLVLGLASDDLALGEQGRRLVEDDEHLIRRRLHHDLHGASPAP